MSVVSLRQTIQSRADKVLGRYVRRTYATVEGEERAVLVSERTGRPNLDSSDDHASTSANTEPSNTGLRSSNEISASEPAALPSLEASEGEEELSPVPAIPQQAEPPRPQQSYSHNEIVYISPDHKELHACCLAASSGGRRQAKYIFLGLAVIAFQGVEKTVGWCTNGKCPQSRAGTHVDPIFEGLHSHQLPSQHYAQDTLICEEAVKLLQALGGEQGLRILLSRQSSSDSADLVVLLHQSANRRAKMAVRNGPSFRDWAMIAEHVSSSAWFCTACSRVHSCGHLAAADKHAATDGVMMMDSDSFERKLRKDFSPEQGN